MSDALLETKSASFGYSGRPVVEDVTLEVRAGEFVALVGPNGSGKTTLLRGLLGFVPLLGGRVERRGGLRMGYVPQRESLDPLYPLSALDVALLGTYGDTRPWRRSSAGARKRAEAALELCHANQLARRRYADLSGGQRQRVLIARALAVQPDLLLLDEPTAGIDSETSESIIATLDGLRREQKVAIWMVSHDLEPLRLRVDRLVRVVRGRLRVEATAT